MVTLQLTDISIENLRGFYSASISLDRPRTLLVGPNNSGKTSLLRLLNWAINELDQNLLFQRRAISEAETQLLLPARDARHRARRLTLYIQISDARSWSKFECESNGIAILRINVRLTPSTVVYASLGNPYRNEPVVTEDNAIELLERLRRSLLFVHIPSFRDARSERFDSTLHTALRTRIEEKALHAAAAGAPREHRQVAKNLTELRNVVLKLTRPLWDDVSSRLPPGLAKEAVLDLVCDQAALLRFLESRLRLRVSTGEHDALAVPIDELGSGLQSLLDLAFQDTQSPSAETTLIIAAEEPEAFLHPAAQRTVASELLKGEEPRKKIIVTTHSPIVVEEAQFGDVVLCRNHQFYEPSPLTEDVRESINTSLLSGFGAEMIFGSSILLVEGEGDRQFFERLRRRIALSDRSGVINRCFVVPVGSKSQFCPWLRLLTSYGDAADRPIRFIVAPDSDAAADIRSSFRDANVSVKKELQAELDAILKSIGNGDLSEWRNGVDRANKIAREESIPLHFLKLDLEEAMLDEASDELLSKISAEFHWTDSPDRTTVMQRLGAKGFGSRNGKKDVYIRGLIGENIMPRNLTTNVKQCLRRWFGNAARVSRADQLLNAWKN